MLSWAEFNRATLLTEDAPFSDVTLVRVADCNCVSCTGVSHSSDRFWSCSSCRVTRFPRTATS